MPKEIGRELLEEGRVKINYDDGTNEVIVSPKPLPPHNLQIDEVTAETEGHIFPEDQIEEAKQEVTEEGSL